MQKNLFLIVLTLITCCLLATTVSAYVASSTNYRLQDDSVNFGGGLSTSSSYKMEDTMGEIASGNGTSTAGNLLAGYQAMRLDTFISISAPSDVTMTPDIDGLTGGTSNGSADWNVTTNNAAGYSLLMRASTNPALTTSGDSFADYASGYADPSFNWSVATDQARFGFSPEGTDIATRFKDDGVTCGTGSLDSLSACWDGFSTSDKSVASVDSPNEATYGATTTVKFRAELGATKKVQAGAYQANIIVTAITL